MNGKRLVRWVLVGVAAAFTLLLGCPNPETPSDTPPTASFRDFEASGAGTASVNGYFRENGTNEGRPKYAQSSGSYLIYYYDANDFVPVWVIHNELYAKDSTSLGVTTYYNGAGGDTPPEGAWSTTGGTAPAPDLQRTSITGTLGVGNTLTGHYLFSDPDGDAEETSTYQWLRYASATDTMGGRRSPGQRISLISSTRPTAGSSCASG